MCIRVGSYRHGMPPGRNEKQTGGASEGIRANGREARLARHGAPSCTILPKLIFYLLMGLFSGGPPKGLAQRLAPSTCSINRRGCFPLFSISSQLALPAHLPAP